MFDQYVFSPEFIKGRVNEIRQKLKENKGFDADQADSHVIKVIADRISKNPGSYIDYGPYWWSLKKVLSGRGYAWGDESYPALEDVYGGESPIETAVMADEFRSEKARTMFFGERTFNLGDGETMTLFDKDMEEACS